MSTAPLQPHDDNDASPIGGPIRPGHGRGAIPFSRRDDVEAIRRDLMEGEQIYGTFGDGTGDIALLGITNRRLIFVNLTMGDDRVGLTSVPLKAVSACSYVTTPDAPLTEATVIALLIGRSTYEMGCTDCDEARDVYGLVMWHLIGL